MRGSRWVAVGLLVAAALATPAVAEEKAAGRPGTYVTDPAWVTPPFAAPPGSFLPWPTLPKENFVPNTFTESVTAEAKMRAAQTMMFFNPMSLRQMMAMMVAKKRVADGISFDEVVESMRLAANKLNFKLVGHNPLHKDVIAITGATDVPRTEIFSFCDAVVAREILDYAPEFVAFLPCRIAAMEDANKVIWLVTLDWDVRWLDTSMNPNRIPDAVRTNAIRIRESIEKIMEAGANGDL
jgi:uncharacterized protein (DUF302 family)